MISNHILNSRKAPKNRVEARFDIIDNLLESRNLYNVLTIDYDLIAVRSTDLDPSENFLLIGLANGSVEIQGIQIGTTGGLEHIYRYNLSPFNIHRVQWNPGHEQFFSMLDNHNLYLVDPEEARAIERFNFSNKAYWSEWSPNDRKMIAVCGTESQTRLVDIRSGSAVQTIILSAKSGLASHRATRCLWSKHDTNCLIIGDNEGYIHIFDTRQSSKPYLCSGVERGQISGMSFTNDNCSIMTSQGTNNRLVQWSYDKCTLVPDSHKFKKQLKQVPVTNAEESSTKSNVQASDSSSKRRKTSRQATKQQTNNNLRFQSRRIVSLPVDAYLKCQFYVTDRHIYCPCPPGSTKAKEFYIYNIESGYRIKTIKSDEILCSGSVNAITGLLPDSLVLYVGGRGRLRVWTLDEDYHRKLEDKMKEYHKTNWDSDGD